MNISPAPCTPTNTLVFRINYNKDSKIITFPASCDCAVGARHRQGDYGHTHLELVVVGHLSCVHHIKID
jgi:hypothetical protein